jgi:hypothetical protein
MLAQNSGLGKPDDSLDDVATDRADSRSSPREPDLATNA